MKQFSEKALGENIIICPHCGGEVEFEFLEQNGAGEIWIDVCCLDCHESSTYYFDVTRVE